jgi:hypothetical protein
MNQRSTPLVNQTSVPLVEGGDMNAMTFIWIAAAMPGVGASVTVLQARLERWDHRRHAED